MQEFKRVFTNRTFLFGLIAILIINAVLFYNEQKENDYGLDLSVANEIIWNTDGQMTIGNDTDAKECYSKYINLLTQYKNTDPIEAQTELTAKLTELTGADKVAATALIAQLNHINGYQVEKPKKVNLTGIVAQIERYKNKKNTLLEMRTDGEISKEEYKEQKEKIEKALLELTEEYERMLATEDAIQNPDICWDEIQSSLDAMIDFSNPQIDRHIIRKFVSKIVPNGRNHFRWYMNLDGKDTTTLDMVTEGRKNNAVISFNDDEEDEPPLHIGDVISLTELQQYFPNLLKNENQNGIITTVGKCGKKSSLDAILHRQLLPMAGNKLYSIR